MNGDTFRKRTRRSVLLMVGVSLMICLVSVVPVSASGSSSGGSGGSSEVTYSSTNLFTNWALVQGDYYSTVIKNPTSCVSRVTVKLPKKPSSVTVDYLSYAIAKYSDKLTTEQKQRLIDTIDPLPDPAQDENEIFEQEIKSGPPTDIGIVIVTGQAEHTESETSSGLVEITETFSVEED